MPRTLLCVPIMVEDPEAALRDAAKARDLGADLVEFRIDHLFQGEDDDHGRAATLNIAERSPLPCIITCRSADEGGDYEGDDAARIALYEALGAAEHPPAYIDVEQSTLARSANLRQKVRLAVTHPGQPRSLTTRLILSIHDFDGRPPSLLRSIEQMTLEDAAAVIKIAHRARSIRDNLELFELLRHRTKPTIALAMGEAGLMSRVLAPKFAGFLTYASLHPTTATAPGQPTISELLDTYRFRSITSATRVYALLGSPVAHSIGPKVHNAVFTRQNQDAVYLPLPVPAGWESFKATLLALLDDQHFTFRGASITIPHKENLLRLAREDGSRKWSIDPSAQLAGAANTLTVHDDGSCRISNTDIAGIIEPLRATLNSDEPLQQDTVAIVGAGGAARAAAAALLDQGATLYVVNRNQARAIEMIDSIRKQREAAGFPPGEASSLTFEECRDRSISIWINCTPVGLAGTDHAEESPIPEEEIERMPTDGVVFDTVYNPVHTPLLAIAESHAIRTIPGLTMFAHQARAQSAQWLTTTADFSLFEHLANTSLASDDGETRIK